MGTEPRIRPSVLPGGGCLSTDTLTESAAGIEPRTGGASNGWGNELGTFLLEHERPQLSD